jgi:hypothetical protein
VDPAVVGFSAPSAEGEAKAQSGSIRASLLEWPEQRVAASIGKTTAFILDLNQHALGAGVDPKRDGGLRPGELERIPQEVSDHRREDSTVNSVIA